MPVTYDLGWYRSLVVETQRGPRRVWAPTKPLRQRQRQLLPELHERCPVHRAASAYGPGCSAFVNAWRHVGARMLLQTDIRHFFDHVTAEMLKQRLTELGFSGGKAARILRVCAGPGFLPQGALTSPLLANTVCYGLDEALTALAPVATYTRYADDVTFSARRWNDLPTATAVEDVLRSAGFQPHKTHTTGGGQPMLVTGLIIGPTSPGKPAVRPSRKLRRRLRSLQRAAAAGAQGLKERIQGLEAHIRYCGGS